MSESLSLLCERNNLKFADLDKIIFHQANARIIEALQKKFDLRDDQLILDIENSGNTSAASIPLAFDKMERKGVIKPGQTIGFAAMGAGLSYGSALVHW